MTKIRLKRLFESVSGGSWGTEPEEGEVTLPCIRGTDFDYPALRSTIATAPVRGFSHHEVAKRAARRGDLIIEKSGGGEKQPVGRVVLHDFDDLVMPTNFASRLTPSEANESRFLTYLMSSLYAGGTTKSSIKQTTGIQNLDVQSFLDTVVFRPSLPEQRAIADFLDAETARIDALIKKKRRMIELLEKRWRSAVEHRMVELAACYGTVSLKRLVQCLDGRRIPLSGEQRAERQSIYPYYGASGAIDQVDDYLFDEELVLLGEDGAQLADPDYEISFVVREKCWINNHAHILRPLTADADFLALHLSTFDRFAFISGSTREKITQEDMWKITVPAIGFEAQRDEAQRLLRLKRKARELGDKLDYQIELLTEHRQALITAAVTGQLEVPGAAAR